MSYLAASVTVYTNPWISASHTLCAQYGSFRPKAGIIWDQTFQSFHFIFLLKSSSCSFPFPFLIRTSGKGLTSCLFRFLVTYILYKKPGINRSLIYTLQNLNKPLLGGIKPLWWWKVVYQVCGQQGLKQFSAFDAKLTKLLPSPNPVG